MGSTGGVFRLPAMTNHLDVVDLAERRKQNQTDFGGLAQKAAEAHLAACWEAYWAEEESENLEGLPESPACAPFCGCETCIVREVLFAAWPIIEEAITEPMVS